MRFAILYPFRFFFLLLALMASIGIIMNFFIKPRKTERYILYHQSVILHDRAVYRTLDSLHDKAVIFKKTGNVDSFDMVMCGFNAVRDFHYKTRPILIKFDYEKILNCPHGDSCSCILHEAK